MPLPAVPATGFCYFFCHFVSFLPDREISFRLPEAMLSSPFLMYDSNLMILCFLTQGESQGLFNSVPINAGTQIFRGCSYGDSMGNFLIITEIP